MADSKTSALTTIVSVDRAADYLYIVDFTDLSSKKVTPNALLGITGDPVGRTDIQTLTNKTITAPTISSPVLSGTVTGTYTIGGTPTFPAAVVTLTGSQTLTNKVLTSPTINTATISNPTLTTDTISEYTGANGVAVDGLNIKDGKLNTANSVVEANYTDASVKPEHLVSGTSANWAWDSWVPTFVGLAGGTLNEAKYVQHGKTVRYRFMYTLAGAGISASVTFTLPVTSVVYPDTVYPIGQTTYLDSGAANYIGFVGWNSTTTGRLYAIRVDGTYAFDNQLSSTIPITWAVNDAIRVSGFYEAA